MNPDLSDSDGVILQTLWEMKALGARAVTIRDLASRLPSVPVTETTERLERLQAQALITRTKRGSDQVVSLSPLGTALVRQLQDRRLGDLTRGAQRGG